MDDHVQGGNDCQCGHLHLPVCIGVSPHPLPGPVVKRILAMMQIINPLLLGTAQGTGVFTRINHGSKKS